MIEHRNQTNLNNDTNIIAKLYIQVRLNQFQFLRINDQLSTMCHNHHQYKVIYTCSLSSTTL